MILQLYSVHDRQADSFANPMYMLAPGQAIRSFADEINRAAADNPLYAHPDDFDLYLLGTFDTNTGEFSHPSRPEKIAIGKNLKLNGSTAP